MIRPAAGLAAFLSALILLAPVPEARQAQRTGRALTIEDYYRVQTIGNHSISPDGKWVAFTLTTRLEEPDANSSRSEAWIVPADGSTEPRRIQHQSKDVTNFSWSDEGWLEYSVDGDRFKIDPSAAVAAPQPLPRGTAGGGRAGRGGRGGGVTTVASADGKWEAVTTNKAQDAPAATYASEFEKRHQERFRGAIFDWKDFQRDGAEFPVPNPTAQPAQQIGLRGRTPDAANTQPSELKVLVDMDLRPSNLAWHPNGSLIAFTADPEWRNELKYASPDLWTVTIDGKVTRVTNDGYVYGDVSYSPDGKYLSYSRSFGTDMIIEKKLNHGGPEDLYVRPTTGGEPINLTANWDLDPGPTRWSPDGRFLYFSAATGGENHLFRVSVPAGQVEQVTRGSRRVNGLVFDKSFTKIVYTVGVIEAPADLYIANIDGSNEKRLTNIHKALVDEIAFSKAERLKWASRDGTQIEGWLTFPHGYDAAKGPYPLIVTSHGGPHAATGYTFDFKDQYFAANGYFVFDTNFRSSTGYGDAFKWATWGAWGDKDGQDVMSGSTTS